MSFFKLLLTFAPWLAFMIIAPRNLVLGLVAGLVLSVVMGITRLHRGIVLWSGLLFFSYCTVSVALFHDMWTAVHMGILANLFLAASSWIGIALKKPFSLDYARDHTDPSLWHDPDFIRANIIITSAWATVFTVNGILAWGKMVHFVLPDLGYDLVSYAFLIGTAAFTTWYPERCRRIREQQQRPQPTA